MDGFFRIGGKNVKRTEDLMKPLSVLYENRLGKDALGYYALVKKNPTRTLEEFLQLEVTLSPSLASDLIKTLGRGIGRGKDMKMDGLGEDEASVFCSSIVAFLASEIGYPIAGMKSIKKAMKAASPKKKHVTVLENCTANFLFKLMAKGYFE